MAQQPPIDPNTGLPILPPNQQGDVGQQHNQQAVQAQQQQYDPNTGQPLQQYDPQTGQPVQPQYDPNTGQPIQPQRQTATVGSPETGPIQIETSPDSGTEQSTEYGHEAIRKIEQQPNPEQSAEQMEQRAAPRPQQPQQQKPQPKPKKPSGPEPPSFYGYKVPLNISTNPKLIAEKKGTGDPSDSRTWVYMFLDRLLKKQSQQG